MHHRYWFAALLSACALFVLAPEARADGFYVTFTDGTTPLTPRLVGAVFDATGSTPVDPSSGLRTGKLMVLPVHVEVDSLQVLVPLLKMQNDSHVFNVTVEFTTPDAQGNEQVYMIGKYTNAAVVAWSTKFDPTATATMKNAVDFIYDTADLTAPPPPAPAPGSPVKKFAVLRAVSKTVPTIMRLAMPTLLPATPPAHVDDAYFQSTNIPGESSNHPNQTRLTAFSFVLLSPRDASTGLSTGKVTPKPLKVSKGSGAATAALQTAMGRNTNLPTISVSFNQHRTGTTDLTLATFTMTNANVTSDALIVANGSSGENLAFQYQRGTVSSGTASMNFDWEAPIE